MRPSLSSQPGEVYPLLGRRSSLSSMFFIVNLISEALENLYVTVSSSMYCFSTVVSRATFSLCMVSRTIFLFSTVSEYYFHDVPKESLVIGRYTYMAFIITFDISGMLWSIFAVGYVNSESVYVALRKRL